MLPTNSVLHLLLDVVLDIVAKVAVFGGLVAFALKEFLADYELVEDVLIFECCTRSGLLGGQETLQVSIEHFVRFDIIKLHLYSF